MVQQPLPHLRPNIRKKRILRHPGAVAIDWDLDRDELYQVRASDALTLLSMSGAIGKKSGSESILQGAKAAALVPSPPSTPSFRRRSEQTHESGNSRLGLESPSGRKWVWIHEERDADGLAWAWIEDPVGTATKFDTPPSPHK